KPGPRCGSRSTLPLFAMALSFWEPGTPALALLSVHFALRNRHRKTVMTRKDFLRVRKKWLVLLPDWVLHSSLSQRTAHARELDLRLPRVCGSRRKRPNAPGGKAVNGAGEAALDTTNRRAIDELFSLTYEELRRLASPVKRGDPSATLNPTALVNEAWLKLANSPELASASRLHFKRIAARAMRQLLVEAARRRNADKRGGGRSR